MYTNYIESSHTFFLWLQKLYQTKHNTVLQWSLCYTKLLRLSKNISIITINIIETSIYLYNQKFIKIFIDWIFLKLLLLSQLLKQNSLTHVPSTTNTFMYTYARTLLLLLTCLLIYLLTYYYRKPDLQIIGLF